MSMESLRIYYQDSSADAFEYARTVLHAERQRELDLLSSLSFKTWAVTTNEYEIPVIVAEDAA